MHTRPHIDSADGTRSHKAPIYALIALLATLVAVCGCESPPLDCYEGQPGCLGIAPDPTAIVQGTVSYRGPRPSCLRNDDGSLVTPIVPVGNAYLLMWQYGFQRVPKGEGSAPHDLLAIPGSQFFGELTEAECMPESPSDADRAVQISRNTTYLWPSIRLLEDRPMPVVIEAFFDHDDDYHPLFAARLSPTKGDTWGGRLGDGALTVLTLDARFSAPGQYVEQVDVVITEVVDTEVPLFRVGDTTAPLSSEAVVPFSELEMFELMNLSVELLPTLPPEYEAALTAGGIEPIDTSATAYSWFIRDFDYYDTERNVGPDGILDQHPYFAFRDDLDVLWRYPVSAMTREQTDAEENFDVTRIPVGQSTPVDVSYIPMITLLPFIRADETVASRARRPELELTTLPGAIMWLMPGDLDCRVNIIPPGNPSESFSDPNLQAWCHELPTGRYGLSMQNGVAGGTLYEVVPERSEACDESGTCYLYTDPMGVQSGYDTAQLWSVPNEIGKTEEIGDAAIVNEQGIEAALVIADPNPDDPQVECERNEMGQQVDLFDRVIETTPVPERCCELVSQLCDLPLCPARPILANDPSRESYFESTRMTEHGAFIRAITADDVDESGRPTCKPFEIPPPCCPL